MLPRFLLHYLLDYVYVWFYSVSSNCIFGHYKSHEIYLQLVYLKIQMDFLLKKCENNNLSMRHQIDYYLKLEWVFFLFL